MAWKPHNTPIIGSIFDNPDEERKLKTMKQVGQSYERARPQTSQARLNMLANQLGAFGPVNNAMATMYGPAATVDMDSFLRNPYTGATINKGGTPDTRIGAGVGAGAGAALGSGVDTSAGAGIGAAIGGMPGASIGGAINGPQATAGSPGTVSMGPQPRSAPMPGPGEGMPGMDSRASMHPAQTGSTDAILQTIERQRRAEAAKRMPGPMPAQNQSSPYPPKRNV